jgi:hypothetical protein
LALFSASVVADFSFCGSLVFSLLPDGAKITLSPDSGQVSHGEPGVSPAKDVGMLLFHISFSSEENKGAKTLSYKCQTSLMLVSPE